MHRMQTLQHTVALQTRLMYKRFIQKQPYSSLVPHWALVWPASPHLQHTGPCFLGKGHWELMCPTPTPPQLKHSSFGHSMRMWPNSPQRWHCTAALRPPPPPPMPLPLHATAAVAASAAFSGAARGGWGAGAQSTAGGGGAGPATAAQIPKGVAGALRDSPRARFRERGWGRNTAPPHANVTTRFASHSSTARCSTPLEAAIVRVWSANRSLDTRKPSCCTAREIENRSSAPRSRQGTSTRQPQARAADTHCTSSADAACASMPMGSRDTQGNPWRRQKWSHINSACRELLWVEPRMTLAPSTTTRGLCGGAPLAPGTGRSSSSSMALRMQ